jgi:hypothetical protein
MAILSVQWQLTILIKCYYLARDHCQRSLCAIHTTQSFIHRIQWTSPAPLSALHQLHHFPANHWTPAPRSWCKAPLLRQTAPKPKTWCIHWTDLHLGPVFLAQKTAIVARLANPSPCSCGDLCGGNGGVCHVFLLGCLSVTRMLSSGPILE